MSWPGTARFRPGAALQALPSAQPLTFASNIRGSTRICLLPFGVGFIVSGYLGGVISALIFVRPVSTGCAQAQGRLDKMPRLVVFRLGRPKPRTDLPVSPRNAACGALPRSSRGVPGLRSSGQPPKGGRFWSAGCRGLQREAGREANKPGFCHDQGTAGRLSKGWIKISHGKITGRSVCS